MRTIINEIRLNLRKSSMGLISNKIDYNGIDFNKNTKINPTSIF